MSQSRREPSLNSIAQNIADVLNRYAIPRLFMVNGWRPADIPKIVPSDVDSPDITQLAGFMTSMASAGVNWFPDGDLENFLRKAARLPVLDDEELEQRRQMQSRTEATRFAEANSQYVQARNNLMMGLNGVNPAQPGEGQGGQNGSSQAPV